MEDVANTWGKYEAHYQQLMENLQYHRNMKRYDGIVISR